MSKNTIIIGEYMQCAGCPAILGTYEECKSCKTCKAKFCIECFGGEKILLLGLDKDFETIIYCLNCKEPKCYICNKENLEQRQCNKCNNFFCYDCSDEYDYTCGDHL